MSPVIAILLLFVGLAVGLIPKDLSGVWVNELNSTMILDVADDHRLSGWYRSGVGNPNGTAFRLAGFVTGSQAFTLGWTVSFPFAGSSAAWSGQYFPKELVISTGWTLTRPVATPIDRWQGTLSGVDIFHPQKP